MIRFNDWPNGLTVNVQKNEKGMALVQVLLITGIIAVLMTVILLNTKSNQNKVLMAEELFKQELLVRTRLAEAKFVLATVDWSFPEEAMGTSGDFVAQWNFYGEPFWVRGVEVSIQNLQSLINFRQPDDLYRLLVGTGVDSEYAGRLVNMVRQQQRMGDYDAPSLPGERLPIQSLGELVALGWPAETAATIGRSIFVQGRGALNLVYLPDHLLPIMLGEARASAIRQLRETGDYNFDMFTRVSDTEFDEFSNYSIGPGFRVIVKNDKATVTLAQDIRIAPYTAIPFQVLSSRRVGH